MKKKFPLNVASILLAVLIVVTFSFIGCKTIVSEDTGTKKEEVTEETTKETAEISEETKESAKSTLKFGITNPSTYEWYTNCVQGFTDYCKANNIEVAYMQTKEEQNALEQVNHVDQMIASDMDAIGIIVSDGDVLVSAVEAAHKAGIPVGTPGAEVNIPKFSENDVDVRIVGGNYQPAYNLAKYMGDLLGGKGNVVIIFGIPGIGVAIDRDKGVNDGLAEFPGIKVLDDQPGNWDSEKSYNVMSDFLTKYDKIDAVFGGFDGGALAAYQAAKAVGRESEMKFFGFDGQVAAFEAIAKNELQATVDMNSYNLGYLLARDLHRAVTYPKFQKTYLEVNYKVVTRENLLDYAPEYSDKFVK
ncbi:MAG: sugar ABC transporter substrate-binding protein [Actinobacteria bacterium]|nr:sugar ABC transporter substrate-binding protein [Actinomycetota bacterium]MCL6086877.1 sugar ABC transporter substrate-binding protein [Actinomycetota bacterium]